MKCRFNPYESFLLIIHKVSFACSPIDKHRFLEELRGRMQQSQLAKNVTREATLKELHDYQTKSLDYWWSKLAHPIELAFLIKRYHLVGYGFFLIFFGHLLILFHFTIKSFIHTFYTGRDVEKIKYFNTIYYPHLAGVLPEPYLFNNLFFALCVYYLSVRLLSAYHLIRNSIINSESYKEITMTQINYPVLTLCNLTLEQWIGLFWHVWSHDREARKHPAAWDAHLSFEPFVQDQLDKLSRKDLMFHLNMVDFEECYKNFNVWDPRARKKRYQSWHCAPPVMRISTSLMGPSLVVTVVGITGALFALAFIIFGMIYIELRNAFQPNQEPSIGEVFGKWRIHLCDPLHLLRLLELFMLGVLQLPQQYDCIMAVIDKTILTSRANKLNLVMERELRLCNDWQSFNKQCSTCLKNGADSRGLANQADKSKKHGRQYLNAAQNQSFESVCTNKQHRVAEAAELNRNIQRHVRLISLVYSEFLNTKRTHSALLNFVVVGNGIVMTYTMSLFFTVSGAPQLVILSVCFVAALVPAMDALISCALIERAFKNLYRLMDRLSVNKLGLLDVKTIKMLMVVSEAFERKEDRSFLIAGLYAITPDSVAPVSR